jgi:hypothetical protein
MHLKYKKDCKFFMIFLILGLYKYPDLWKNWSGILENGCVFFNRSFCFRRKTEVVFFLRYDLKTLSNFFMFFPQKTADLSKKSAAF